MELTLLHASDIHFGKHFDPVAAEAFSRFRKALSLDLIVLSGDFTQRAKIKEYQAARVFLDGLKPIPVVVTPGNHDVPLYRLWERIFAPHGNYRTYIADSLNAVTRVPGATIVSLDSTAPHTAIVNGRISHAQLRFASASFEGAAEGDIKILVSHHNLARAPGDESEKILRDAKRCLSALAEMGVELVLGGHLHRTFWVSFPPVLPERASTRPISIVHTGTTTSRRGRAREKGRNSLNLIRISKEEVRVVPHLLDRESGAFVPREGHRIPRVGRGPS